MRQSIVLLAVCAACGGNTESTQGSGGSGNVSAGATGGAGDTDGGSSGGATPPIGGGCGGYPPFYCVPTWCGGDVLMSPICVGDIDKSWACEEGWVPPNQCPDDACFHTPTTWCCDALGNYSAPTCPNQAAEVCPDDTYLNRTTGAFCAPTGSFPCGSDTSCVLGVEYCRNPESGTWVCETLPAACDAAPDCACLQSLACGSCSDAGIGAITLHCY